MLKIPTVYSVQCTTDTRIHARAHMHARTHARTHAHTHTHTHTQTYPYSYDTVMLEMKIICLTKMYRVMCVPIKPQWDTQSLCGLRQLQIKTNKPRKNTRRNRDKCPRPCCTKGHPVYRQSYHAIVLFIKMGATEICYPQSFGMY